MYIWSHVCLVVSSSLLSSPSPCLYSLSSPLPFQLFSSSFSIPPFPLLFVAGLFPRFLSLFLQHLLLTSSPVTYPSLSLCYPSHFSSLALFPPARSSFQPEWPGDVAIIHLNLSATWGPFKTSEEISTVHWAQRWLWWDCFLFQHLPGPDSQRLEFAGLQCLSNRVLLARCLSATVFRAGLVVYSGCIWYSHSCPTWMNRNHFVNLKWLHCNVSSRTIIRIKFLFLQYFDLWPNTYQFWAQVKENQTWINNFITQHLWT